MAFQIKKIYPLDLEPNKAIGVGLPFSAGNVFNQTYQTKDAIKANLINYFLTNRGERYLNPKFGSDIRKLLFENITEDSIEELKAAVLDDLSVYFPRVQVDEFNIKEQLNTNMVTFYMKFSITDTNISDELMINFEQ